MYSAVPTTAWNEKGSSRDDFDSSTGCGDLVRTPPADICVPAAERRKPLPAVPAERVGLINRWIADTGSGHDVLDELLQSSEGHRRKTTLDNGEVFFSTAGGLASSTSSVSLYSCFRRQGTRYFA